MDNQSRSYRRLVDTLEYLKEFYLEAETELFHSNETAYCVFKRIQEQHAVSLKKLQEKIEAHPLHQK